MLQRTPKFSTRKASRARQNTWHVGHVRYEAHGNILSRKRCKAVNSVQNFWHVGHVRQEGQANTLAHTARIACFLTDIIYVMG